MKFMKLRDLEIGDCICVNERFVCQHYFNSHKGYKEKEVYIIKVRNMASHTGIEIFVSEQISGGFQGAFSVYEDEVYEDYPIKVIKLRDDI